MPWFPGVALDEVEALGVRREPAVGGRRPEVELGAETVKALAGARDPAGIGVRREQARLLGIRAVRARDRQLESRLATRGGGKAVERHRHAGAHALALAVRERP